MFQTSKFPSIFDESHRIDVIDDLVREQVGNHISGDPLEYCMLNDSTSKNKNPEVVVCSIIGSLSTSSTLSFQGGRASE